MHKYINKIKKAFLILYYYINLGIKKVFNKKKGIIFLLGSPYKGNNLGDYAIDMAEDKFFFDYLNDYLVLRIPDLIIWPHVSVFKFLVGKSKILVHGGGFLGTLWTNGENMTRKIIETFPDNYIYILPQTIYFSDDSDGDKCLNESIKIYNRHQHLTIFVRDRQSLNLIRNNFKNVTVFYVPDIVTCLNINKCQERNNQIILCLRRDKEKILDIDIDNVISEMKFLHDNSFEILHSDNVINSVYRKEGIKNVEKQLEKFASSKLVITDRLHGMIFAAITSTPCLCMDNKSGKVRGVYEWIKKNKYIKFIDNELRLQSEIETLLRNINDYEYDNKELIPYFEKIAKIIIN